MFKFDRKLTYWMARLYVKSNSDGNVDHKKWYLWYLAVAVPFCLLPSVAAVVLDSPLDYYVVGALLVVLFYSFTVWFRSTSLGNQKVLYDDTEQRYGQALADRIQNELAWRRWWEE